MYAYINEYEFVDEMMGHGFSYDGARALFGYLEELEEDLGENIEFDPISFRCDLSEFESVKEAYRDITGSEPECDEDLFEFAHEYLVREFDGGVIIINH